MNERGISVGAAAAVVLRGTTDGGTPVEFTANRPFLYLIRDRQSGALLTVGEFLDPAAP